MNKLMKVAKVGFAIYGAYNLGCILWVRFGLGKEAWEEAQRSAKNIIDEHS